MEQSLSTLLNEIIETGKRHDKNQSELVKAAGLGEVTLSRAKKANDIRFSTLSNLAKTVGLRIALVPDIPIVDKIKSGMLFK